MSADHRKDNVRFLHPKRADRSGGKRDPYQTYFEQNPSGMYLASMPSGVLENCNQAFAHLLGFESPLELLGKQLSEFFAEMGSFDVFHRNLTAGENLKGDQQRFKRKDGTMIWILQDITWMGKPGMQDSNILGTVVDITNSKQKEEQFLQSALYDSLTGLPNRSLFLDRLSVCYDRARRNQEYTFAVLFLDLDHFKSINDGFGHRVGDELLVAAARRLYSKIRSSDTVARLGGDEFAVLLDVSDTLDATRAASRIQEAFKNPFRLGDRELFISISTGIAMSSGQWFYKEDGVPEAKVLTEPSSNIALERPQDLLWAADAVLYRAKQLGRARYEVFDEEMHQKVLSRTQLEMDLRKAVEEDQFENLYQAVVSLETGKIIGFEACLRWRHPVREMLEPSAFGILAEQMGLQGIIDRLFVKKACLQLQNFQKSFPGQLFMSANLSVAVFHDSDFLRFIRELMQSLHVGNELLWFEIPESSLIEHLDRIQDSLVDLRAIGISIMLDDFGTGFSSLKGLPQFPVDVLKIDSSLIEGMKMDEMYVEVVGTLIALGHSLGFSIFAEGVETEQQIVELKRVGCDGAQGPYFSVPVTAAAANKLLKDRSSSSASS